VGAAHAAEEVRSCRSAADELDVQVGLADPDVAEEASEAVDVVEPRIRLELDVRAAPDELLELALRLVRVALPLLELGCIDLHEPHARPARKLDRVAVRDAFDRRRSVPGRLRCLSATPRARADESDRDGQERC
jgi:hypothetical protein